MSGFLEWVAAHRPAAQELMVTTGLFTLRVATASRTGCKTVEMQKFRFEGLSLTVGDVRRSVEFYAGTLGLEVAYDAAPAFAMVRSADGGTIGLLSREEASKDGVVAGMAEQRRGLHVEFTTDDLDSLYADLTAAGVRFAAPPHEEPWERSMTAYDPDGHSVEFAEGHRGDINSGDAAARI